MRITVLVENTAREGYLSEHGLSLYIETNGKRILFDMGQSDIFFENANKIGIDLSKVDFAVLSHGHYDHGGGLARFMQINESAPIYINEHAFEAHYNGTEKYIGLDTSLKSAEKIIFTSAKEEIAEGITLYSCADKEKKYDLGAFGLTCFENGKFFPEDFRHEQYMLVNENGKSILFSGCSHRGILDIAEWFKADAIIGGFHFSKLPLDDTLASYAKQLAKSDIHFFTCHCTGVEQYEFMKPYMKKLDYIKAGDTFEL